jgi:trimeric autotransporter adhesin
VHALCTGEVGPDEADRLWSEAAQDSSSGYGDAIDSLTHFDAPSVAKKPAVVQLPPLSLKGSSSSSGAGHYAGNKLPPLSPSASLQHGEQAGYVPAEWGEVGDTPLLEDDEALSELMREEHSMRLSSASGGSVESSVRRKSSAGSSSSKSSKRPSAEGDAPGTGTAAAAGAALAAWPEADSSAAASAAANSSSGAAGAAAAAASSELPRDRIERLVTMGSDERYEDVAQTPPLTPTTGAAAAADSATAAATSASTNAAATAAGSARPRPLLKPSATFSSLPVSAQHSGGSLSPLRTTAAVAAAAATAGAGASGSMPPALLMRAGSSMPRLLSAELQRLDSGNATPAGSPTAAAAAVAAGAGVAGGSAAVLRREHSEQLHLHNGSPSHSERHMNALHRMQHAAGKAAAEAAKAAAEADIAEFNRKLAQEGMQAVSASQMKLMHNVVKTLSGAPQPGAALAGDVAAEVSFVLCNVLFSTVLQLICGTV